MFFGEVTLCIEGPLCSFGSTATGNPCRGVASGDGGGPRPPSATVAKLDLGSDIFMFSVVVVVCMTNLDSCAFAFTLDVFCSTSFESCVCPTTSLASAAPAVLVESFCVGERLRAAGATSGNGSATGLAGAATVTAGTTASVSPVASSTGLQGAPGVSPSPPLHGHQAPIRCQPTERRATPFGATAESACTAPEPTSQEEEEEEADERWAVSAAAPGTAVAAATVRAARWRTSFARSTATSIAQNGSSQRDCVMLACDVGRRTAEMLSARTGPLRMASHMR